MTNKELAQIVADRLSDRILEDLSEIVGELAMDVLTENGVNPDSDDAWETLMDVSSRIYIGAQ